MAGKLPTLATRLRALLEQLPYLPRAFALVWAATRYWTLAWAILLVLQGLLPVAIVYLTRWIVDGLVEAVAAGGSWQSVRPTLILVVLMAGVMLANELLTSATGWVRAAQAELVQDHINTLIHEKSVAVDLAFYESPEYYDHLHRARVEARYRPLTLLENAGSLAQNSITLVAMAAVLIPFGLWLPIALLLSTFPALFVVLRYSLRERKWRLRRTADERRAWYYDWSLTSGETAAEIRLFGLGKHFESAFQALRRRLREERLQLARDEGVAQAAARTLGLLVTGAALAWMAWKTMQGLITLGQLALFYQAFHQGQRLMRSLLQNVGRAYANILFLSNLFEFLDLEPQVLDPRKPSKMPAPLMKGIGFHGVTFRYPDSERLALRDFNLFIPAGKTVAIVGGNGAGKSTLIKLICRLYDPDDGQIELDGIDLRDLSLQELRGKIAVLLQEPVHYHETVAENIRLGDVATVMDSIKIKSAAAAGRAREVVERLPRGYDTLLGKWFVDGTELSVGEWKRISLARTFFRRAPIILLDEPTSGMDSWAETEWMDHFSRVPQGQTAVIITHRFTTAMRADIIHVMQDGQIVESGGHDELLATEGEYARSWRRQRRQSHQTT
ncbi:ABC transporter ATP-binding protein/permease [Acidobacteria bacterium AH-259-G07]|nr:ABC transporter ATP-binding protein/permease [Acidobacteria bacterium AH-259-G07]